MRIANSIMLLVLVASVTFKVTGTELVVGTVPNV